MYVDGSGKRNGEQWRMCLCGLKHLVAIDNNSRLMLVKHCDTYHSGCVHSCLCVNVEISLVITVLLLHTTLNKYNWDLHLYYLCKKLYLVSFLIE